MVPRREEQPELAGEENEVAEEEKKEEPERATADRQNIYGQPRSQN